MLQIKCMAKSCCLLNLKSWKKWTLKKTFDRLLDCEIGFYGANFHRNSILWWWVIFVFVKLLKTGNSRWFAMSSRPWRTYPLCHGVIKCSVQSMKQLLTSMFLIAALTTLPSFPCHTDWTSANVQFSFAFPFFVNTILNVRPYIVYL